MTQPFAGIAQYYDVLYGGKDYAAEANYIASLLRQQGVVKNSLLNLGCGTGRHDVELAKLGWQVHGVDLSEQMIQRAQDLRLSTGLQGLSFSVGDARTVRLGRKFDAVVSLFHVTSYQCSDADVAGYFESIASHLGIGGILIFDFWHSAGVLSDPPETRVKRMTGATANFIRLAEPHVDHDQNLIKVRYTILTRENGQSAGHLQQDLTEEHNMRHFSVPELRLHLNVAGLSVVDVHAWMKPGSDVGKAWYGCIVARKMK
jgi:SAM-dependent methyltransferase